jgi:hypothetical protein
MLNVERVFIGDGDTLIRIETKCSKPGSSFVKIRVGEDVLFRFFCEHLRPITYTHTTRRRGTDTETSCSVIFVSLHRS